MQVELYDIEAIDEAMEVVEYYRHKYKYDIKGEPHKVAQCNVWTALKWELKRIKQEMLNSKHGPPSPTPEDT